MRRLQLLGWTAVGTVLCALAVPWFLWGDSTVVAGLPLWLWWHVGWMGLASVVFWLFAQRAWGIGIEPGREGDSSDANGSETSGLEHGDRSSRPATGGDRP
ncbi:DUF3311 domain-containing protein [Haloterrigena sp. SYSU A558-1]|uniref:DUF3311 domain-containing protein n=1 Tax=Haloterrigena gelatinilytica TaxID=2741724 RepID=A0A8J8KDF6_9EURY|nr:DUF3311 domain-containing protein [Haloterrigena gelatinilytica]NUB89561.1 DUF3311 domain-containing protein [Haloterrigena gelatinilytica]NUC74609.1 DUF3311 domain-containing protein [Haloterrigena gelatinilytica]